MKDNDSALLETAGWAVECLSPLELRHSESGSFASGLAASYVLAAVREEGTVASATPDPLASNPAQLAERVQLLRDWMRDANTDPTDAKWERTYKLVFSPYMSQTLGRLLGELGQTLDYYDPDGSYQDDVQAYARAWDEKVAQLKAHFSELASVT